MRTRVMTMVACLLVAGCGSGKTDMWAEVPIPSGVTDSKVCALVGVVDVPQDWKPVSTEEGRTYFKFGLKQECRITSDHAAGVVETYLYSRNDEKTRNAREVLEAYLESLDTRDVEIREAKIGALPGFEAVWHSSDKPNRAFAVMTKSGSHVSLMAAVGAPDDKFEDTVLPVYLLARKSFRE